MKLFILLHFNLWQIGEGRMLLFTPSPPSHYSPHPTSSQVLWQADTAGWSWCTDHQTHWRQGRECHSHTRLTQVTDMHWNIQGCGKSMERVNEIVRSRLRTSNGFCKLRVLGVHSGHGLVLREVHLLCSEIRVVFDGMWQCNGAGNPVVDGIPLLTHI